MIELEWEDMDERTRMRMRWLGDFMPTRNHGSIRGWMHDKEEGGATEEYLTIDELRELGRSCFRVALWLEVRRGLPAKEVEGWYCPRCVKIVSGQHVTFSETHDPRCGGYGGKEEER